MSPELKGFILLSAVKMLGVFGVLNVAVMMIIWQERRQSAFAQDRLGPNRVGPFGLLQSLADGIKNIAKEETVPTQADRTLFFLAPALAIMPAMMTFAVIPFAAPLPVSFDWTLPLIGRIAWDGAMPMVVADLPVGFLFILAMTSLGVYGIVLAGWASNSKYAFLGGLRASAQMVSYEIAMGLTLITVMLVAGNVTLGDIVARQQESLWFIFPLFVGALMFGISALAETNRLPFDLPETESELITGYHTEYSSMKFSMFFIAEYSNIITAAALAVTLFLGGWDIPFTSWDNTDPSLIKTLATLVVFTIKTWIVISIPIQLRWTLPRFRFDQLMQLGWKVMLPLALAYIVIMAFSIFTLETMGVAFGPLYALLLLVPNLVVAFFLFGVLDRGRLLGGASHRTRRIA